MAEHNPLEDLLKAQQSSQTIDTTIQDDMERNALLNNLSSLAISLFGGATKTDLSGAASTAAQAGRTYESGALEAKAKNIDKEKEFRLKNLQSQAARYMVTQIQDPELRKKAETAVAINPADVNKYVLLDTPFKRLQQQKLEKELNEPSNLQKALKFEEVIKKAGLTQSFWKSDNKLAIAKIRIMAKAMDFPIDQETAEGLFLGSPTWYSNLVATPLKKPLTKTTRPVNPSTGAATKFELIDVLDTKTNTPGKISKEVWLKKQDRYKKL